MSSVAGSTRETAVKVTDIQAEYDYVGTVHGLERIDWSLRSQRVEKKDGKTYDVLAIVLKDTSKKEYWFDITSFCRF